MPILGLSGVYKENVGLPTCSMVSVFETTDATEAVTYNHYRIEQTLKMET